MYSGPSKFLNPASQKITPALIITIFKILIFISSVFPIFPINLNSLVPVRHFFQTPIAKLRICEIFNFQQLGSIHLESIQVYPSSFEKNDRKIILLYCAIFPAFFNKTDCHSLKPTRIQQYDSCDIRCRQTEVNNTFLKNIGFGIRQTRANVR